MAPSKHVLVVEDDHSVREMLKSVLEFEGYRVSAAENGHHAAQLLDRIAQPDAILLDIMMPVMNGWEFIDFLKAKEKFQPVPIIVISAYLETAKSVKPTAIIQKPIQLKDLLTALEKVA